MNLRVAVVGATGVIGKELVKILVDKGYRKENISFLASKNSVGTRISFGENESVMINDVNEHDFSKDRVAFFVAGSGISRNLGRSVASIGCLVLDGSSCFRMEEDVPLVIPEVNPHVLNELPGSNIIASPNCSTTQMLVALKPLHSLAKLSRIWVSTYQSVSGVGESGMDELYENTKRRFAFTQQGSNVFPRNIEFNCIPQIGEFDKSGFSDEELKLINETQKILEDKSIEVFPTCVRVPVFVGHAESITVELKEDVYEEDVYEILSDAEGVVFSRNQYKCQPEVVGYDDVFVSRIRFHSPRMISMWVVADNLRKGGALNLVQILDLLPRGSDLNNRNGSVL
ncbi:aspartate-semialdehyde dehydrogenase [Neorickettsia helminthoeca str. Oregon]|uniref:Aspartate-semialdehyde dehydrogenase n=1 Tax=Neorickettsia helminthoeca str. Oregon TaxID=1286528 RepID=X5HLE5_9RICK|nr:aspartate-semialdehyde dehydrogenase [Neorickettsia helminthoeca]AHX11205.1 aspartate-semialdehyde dehydrogenase [Neorickettsia helminthoeca str. Oregon]